MRGVHVQSDEAVETFAEALCALCLRHDPSSNYIRRCDGHRDVSDGTPQPTVHIVLARVLGTFTDHNAAGRYPGFATHSAGRRRTDGRGCQGQKAALNIDRLADRQCLWAPRKATARDRFPPAHQHQAGGASNRRKSLLLAVGAVEVVALRRILDLDDGQAALLTVACRPYDRLPLRKTDEGSADGREN